MLGHDGVYRSFDGARNILDAVALSPTQIKKILDQMPWNQKTEERFRGVDGQKTLSLPYLLSFPFLSSVAVAYNRLNASYDG